MFPLRLRHDDVMAPVATAYVTAAPPDYVGPQTCQMATYWAARARLPFYVSDKAPSEPGAPSRAGVGSGYVLWSAQLLSIVDVETIALFKHAAASFHAVGPLTSDATAAPLYCRFLLVRRMDGRLISGNAARALIGWAALPPPPAAITDVAARDRELAHDEREFLSQRPVEPWISLAARLPDYFVFVRINSQYFSIQFGAIVIAVGVGADTAAALPAGPSTSLTPLTAVTMTTHGFVVDEVEDGVVLVTVVERDAATAAWTVRETPPEDAERALVAAGFLAEGENAMSVTMAPADVVALLRSWGWVEVDANEVA